MRRLLLLVLVTLLALSALSVAAKPNSRAQQEQRSVSLSPGCNMAALTFAGGTDAATVAGAVSPAGALQTIWRLDNATRTFEAYAAAAPQASDLLSVNLLDAVFLCVDADASLSMPTVSPGLFDAMSMPLTAGCNVLGLTYPDGTAPSDVADAVSPAGMLNIIWRLDNATGSFEAYAVAAPEASDLTSLQFLDAVFVCTGVAAVLEMPALAGVAAAADLNAVTSWAYQIQELDADGAVDALVASDYDLLVIEPTRSVVGSEEFDTAGLVARLHERAKLVLAYIDIGEGEDYRTYWQDEWEAPSAGERGVPDFLVTADPDGWSGNYPVAFWDQRWKNAVIYDEGSLLDMALDDGFDGIYMDWVEAYMDEHVAAVAQAEGLDPAAEMVSFIREIRDYGRARRPGFLVVAQNAAELAEERSDYLEVIDGLAQENLSFRGEADTEWGEPAGTPLPTGKTKWQIVIDKLGEQLEMIPIAYGPWEEGQGPATATIDISNFEVVEPATPPATVASRPSEAVLSAAAAGNREHLTCVDARERSC